MIITSQFIFLFFLAVILTLATMLVDLRGSQKRLGEKFVHFLRFILVSLLILAIIGMGIANFQATLTLLVAGTGMIALIDRLFVHKKRMAEERARPLIVENAYAFFGVLLLVWAIRSFLIQPYRVPTGSLLPTIEPGDFLAVNQFAYGFRFPVINKKLVAVAEPKRGEIALFYYPVDPNVVFIKRVIGLPGDHIEFKNKVLYINGKEMKQTFIESAVDHEPATENNPEEHLPIVIKQENLDGIKHRIYMSPFDTALSADFNVDVPAGNYFMMGDNRDNSGDSRVWGFVPEKNLIGKALVIWMNWDPLSNKPKWHRIGHVVK
jgi:signal peptidase I